MGPIIRIGLLTDAKEILVSSTGSYYIQENEPEASRRLVQGAVRVQVEKDTGTVESTPCFRIQVASFRNRESAEELVEALSETFKVKVVISENDDAASSRVRVGEFPSREEAGAMWNTLKSSGYPDAFIVEDVLSNKAGQPVLVLRGADNLFYVNSKGFLFLPSSATDFLSVNGKAYRGILEIRLNGSSRITVINQLGLEEYLPGVVPAEMSPSEYPEFAAQAAQAIAARTYALKHMGSYRADGFDLTDDTNTQVYMGVGIEKSISNDAVLQTAGLAIYYGNELIDAMYMSTCGGRTEDFSNVYDAPPVPYLKSVFCAVEGGQEEDGTIIAGNHSLKTPLLADDGSLANRNLEFARILGIVEAGYDFSGESLSGTATKSEAAGWVGNALKVIQRPQQKTGSLSACTRIGFLQYAAETVFGPEEILRTVSKQDASYYLDNLSDGNTVLENTRAALAYLMRKSLWRPFPDNTVRPDEPISRSEAIFLLLRWIESIRPDILHNGVFTGTNTSGSGGNPASELQIKWGDNVQQLLLSDTAPVFRMEADRAIPVDRMKIIGNEKTRFHIGPNNTIDFLEVELNPTGAASDRYSPVATWDVTLSRSDIEKNLRNLSGDIGFLKDMKPSRIGNSGRMVQIQAVGSRSSVVLNGYKVRGALGLRDTLFTLTRRYNPDGTIAEFTFHGRGFGHGVGLCQVGASGMAKAGKSYEEILKTYYQGVEVRRAY